jgi:undecaprenyl-diphosphatase
MLMRGAGLLIAVTRVLWPQHLNSSYYLDLNDFSRHTAWAHAFMHDYALWLGLVLMTLTFLATYAVAWWHRQPRAVGLLALGGAGTLVALGLNQLVGHAAQEMRPYDTYRNALVLVAKAHDYAFPSDHAVVAGALFTSILLAARRAAPSTLAGEPPGKHALARPRGRRLRGATLALTVLGALFGLFLGFARVYVGAHYPGDVVAGFLLGAMVVMLASAARPASYWLAGLALSSPFAWLVCRPGGQQPKSAAALPQAAFGSEAEAHAP